MWNKRFIIGCLTTLVGVAVVDGTAYGQTWTGDSGTDCNWSTAENWTPDNEFPGTCDDVIIVDPSSCSTVFVEAEVESNREPNDMHIGYDMTIYFEDTPQNFGLFVRGTLFVIGVVKFDGPAGNDLKAAHLRMGELNSSTGVLLRNQTTNSPFEGGQTGEETCS
jgi:hypothetical protein